MTFFSAAPAPTSTAAPSLSTFTFALAIASLAANAAAASSARRFLTAVVECVKLKDFGPPVRGFSSPWSSGKARV